MAKKSCKLVLVAHDIRSAHNVGSLLRTADGLGIELVILTGYSPYPETKWDTRPPHIRKKVTAAISKTALGAEKTINWEHRPDIMECMDTLSDEGFEIVALEQTAGAININDFKVAPKTAVIVGNEVSGLSQDVLDKVNTHLRIPMLGAKESFNVAVAAAMALYHLRHLDKYSS